MNLDFLKNMEHPGVSSEVPSIVGGLIGTVVGAAIFYKQPDQAQVVIDGLVPNMDYGVLSPRQVATGIMASSLAIAANGVVQRVRR